MSARPSTRALTTLAAALVATTLAACGGEVVTTTPPKVDPAPAERVLTAYLDDDRCDLLSDRKAGTIAPDPEAGRQLCERGQLPVDAMVKPGQYEVTDAEIIDGNGLFTVELNDGGTRDYVLIPGGDEGFQVDSVENNTEVDLGEPLRLQARPKPTEPPADARITVRRVDRLSVDELSDDEFVSSLNHYYRVRVRVQNLIDEPIVVGSTGFTLVQKDGVAVGETQAPFSDIGPLLPSTVAPGDAVSGYLFFVIPSAKIARPTQVRFSMGTGYTGAELIWNRE